MIEITVPRLGWSMEEGTFSEWLKREGDWVEKGDMLFVLESDKAAQEIESFEAGVLRIGPDSPKPGESVKVGQVIGYLAARDDNRPIPMPETEHAPQSDRPPVSDQARESQPSAEPAPSAGKPARNAAAPFASPRARRAAQELGVDWRTLAGTGRRGRIRERDVLATPATGGDRKESKEPNGAPISATRRTIAGRMLDSLRSTAPVTLTTTIDATNLVNLRAQFKAAASHESPPGITDIVVKLAAKGLEAHPDLNARWQDDQIVRLTEINIGIAVDAETGLLVPVLRNVPHLGLKQIAALSRHLIEQARGRRLTADELRGGTFTVTNLGMYGIDAFTPIINLPETAILGVGSVRREPVVLNDDRIVPGHVMTLSLTFDHRVVDGAPAARFLQTLRKLLENPAASLVG
ncbi:MAG TPA: dihydrolipoamide acetyltransferase family protein [Pirellulales bacterium]|nr:dihydrolipoamide acetyltransferase family protein [Pirellulales bacterium]